MLEETVIFATKTLLGLFWIIVVFIMVGEPSGRRQICLKDELVRHGIFIF